MKRKFKMSGGLAFSDKEDMELLHKYAKKGWVFKRLRFGMLYELHEEEPQTRYYDYDIQKIKKEEKDDYLSVFHEAGWELVGAWDKDIRFFSSTTRIESVHSEKETRSDQYKLYFIIGVVLTVVGIIGVGIAIWKEYMPMAMIGGGSFGGGAMLGLGSYFRTKGKRMKIDTHTVWYHMGSLMIGFVIWIACYMLWDGSIYDWIVLVIGIGFVISSIYGFYILRKEKQELSNE